MSGRLERPGGDATKVPRTGRRLSPRRAPQKAGYPMIPELREAFASIGAQATIDVAGRSFSVERIAPENPSLFKIQIPVCGMVKVRAQEVDRLRQCLVVEFQDGRSSLHRRIWCGQRNGAWVVRPLSTSHHTGGRRRNRSLAAGSGRLRENA